MEAEESMAGVCKEHKYQAIFSVLNGMQTRYCDEKAVCQTRAL